MARAAGREDAVTTERPTTPREAADVLRVLSDRGLALRFGGARTKWEWGEPCEAQAVVETTGLDAVVEHNAHDLTVIVQAGARLADVQAVLGEAGQMLALDPPLGPESSATVGGIMATADSGPLRHRYKAPRDLVLGMTVALSDGTLARTGSKVIKNVAGYDIAKLFTGSFGTLGLIVELIFRLHPRPARTVTVVGTTDDAAALQRGAMEVAHAPSEVEALDVAYRNGTGRVLAQFGGIVPEDQAEAVVQLLRKAGCETEVHEDDSALWDAQRSDQRAHEGAVVKVSAVQTDLHEVIAAVAALDASLVGRAGLGIHHVRLSGDDEGLVSAIEELRARLAPRPTVVRDAPPEVRAKISVWGDVPAGTLELMQQVKSRFDPSMACAPGIFVGGL